MDRIDRFFKVLFDIIDGKKDIEAFFEFFEDDAHAEDEDEAIDSRYFD